MAAPILSADRLRELLRYDPTTGVFTWRYARSGISPGPAGAVGGTGYVYISVDGRRYLAHRLVWMHVHGKWPDGDTDHINCNRADNRLSNLRDVPRYVNNQNRSGVQSNNRTSGATGVTWHHHSRKWIARISLRGKTHRLGLFETVEEASAAYLEAKRRLHEGCTI